MTDLPRTTGTITPFSVLLEAMLDIKRLAESVDDDGYDNEVLLEMIASEAIAAIKLATQCRG